MSVHSRLNWNLEVLVFKDGKTGVPGEKPLGALGREPTTNSTHIWPLTPGFEPQPHWWEASALSAPAPR